MEQKTFPGWLRVVFGLGGYVGVVFQCVILFLIPWLRGLKMNGFEIIVDILCVVSMGYGIFLVVKFLRDVSSRLKTLEKDLADRLQSLDRDFTNLQKHIAAFESVTTSPIQKKAIESLDALMKASVEAK